MGRTVKLGALLLLPGVGFVFGASLPWPQRERAGGKKEGWVDYADLEQAGRLKERPGNYQLLGALVEFLDGMYKVRPDYSMCAFPFQSDSGSVGSLKEAERVLDEAVRGRTRRNKLRSYNLDIKSLSVHDPDEMLRSEDLRKKVRFGGKWLARLRKVRKNHPGRAALVLANLPLASLRSPKVEGGDRQDVLFYLVHSQGRWKVAWFDK
jgi:hypothetical protein